MSATGATGCRCSRRASSSTRCARSWVSRRRSAGSSSPAAPGHFALHAKVFVIDRERAFVGSMNFDQRSLRINTEIGLIIDSPQIAREIAARFDAITQPANSYRLVLEPADERLGRVSALARRRRRQPVRLDTEPGTDAVKRALDRHAFVVAAGRTALVPTPDLCQPAT